MIIIKSLILLAVGIVVLVAFSDLFVDASSSLAIRLKIPKMVIALTIAAFGTCMPELAISFRSITSSNSEMTLANVIGSCIVNILLIIGIASIMHPIKVKNKTIKNELLILLITTFAFFILLSDSIFNSTIITTLSRLDAFILILFFIYFMYYIIKLALKSKNDYKEIPKYSLIKSIISIPISLILIVLASNLVVDNVVILAEKIGMSQKFITMTIISIGTSLPELTTTIMSAKKGEFEMSLGNIIGTNIFNICIVLCLPILIYGGISSPSFNLIDSFIVLIAVIMFYCFGKSGRQITRREGILMVFLFIIYYLYLFLN